MRIVRLLATVFFVAIVGASTTWAQTQTAPCQKETDEIMPQGTNCTSAQSIMTGAFNATPFIDAVQNIHGNWPDYGDQDHNVVSLYGTYGNNENNPSFTQLQTHYQQGITLANKITPLCQDGSLPSGNTCPPGQPAPAIVFLFIGMSNFDIELGGGNKDAWSNDPQMLSGQPCSSVCPNLNNPNMPNAWNQVPGDPAVQESLLYQIYSPTTHLVGAHVVVWNGALEGQALAQWDPSPAGYYNGNITCPYQNEMASGPECNYERVQYDLGHATANGNTNGYSEKQVQAVFIKVADLFPQCDLKKHYCNLGITQPDAYQMETYLGDIVRYLKCCEINPPNQSRYPNLQQVFITSRIYGGYANGQQYGNTCENPEPFAYEGGFAVQRLVIDQINQASLYPGAYDYGGEVDYSVAPWIDWGPYLWASGTTQRSDGLAWCNGVLVLPGCASGDYDFREGDIINPSMYWGDYTHPTARGQGKVANLLLNFINKTTGSPWVTPWIGK